MARAVCAGAPSCWKMYPLGNQNSLERVSRIIVYKHYVTDDVINGKVVTGYFLIIERILNDFRAQVFVQSF